MAVMFKHLNKKTRKETEMRFLRAVKSCTRGDLIRNDNIRMKLGIAESLNEKISRYKMEWRLHVETMDPTRFARRALEYYARGKRSVVRPVSDGWMTSIETGTGY